MASKFSSWVAEHSDWELVAPTPFSTVVFRYVGKGLTPEQQDACNLQVLGEVNRTGEMFISDTRLDGKVVLRLSIGNIQSKDRHIKNAWDLLQKSSMHFTTASGS